MKKEGSLLSLNIQQRKTKEGMKRSEAFSPLIFSLFFSEGEREKRKLCCERERGKEKCACIFVQAFSLCLLPLLLLTWSSIHVVRKRTKIAKILKEKFTRVS